MPLRRLGWSLRLLNGTALSGAVDLRIDPLEEGSVELLDRHAGDLLHHGPTLPLVHEVPHRRHRGLAAALIGGMGVVRYEMEFATAMDQAALLEFVTAHGGLSLG